MQVRQRDSRLPHRGQARCTVVVGEAFLLGHGRTIGLFPVFQIHFKRVRIVVHRPKGGLQLFGGTPGKRDDSNEKGNGADGGVASFHFFGLGNFPSDVKMVTKRLSYKKNQIISVCFVIKKTHPCPVGRGTGGVPVWASGMSRNCRENRLCENEKPSPAGMRERAG